MIRANFRPYEGNEPYIFISYAHKNSEAVFPILEKLDAAGYRVWYDDGIAPGSEWPEYIAEHLNNCSVVIAFVSPESIASPNCRREVTYALAKQKPFLGVMLEKTQMSPGMELQLSAQQCILRYNYRTEEEFEAKLLDTAMLKPCQKPVENTAAAAASQAVNPAVYAGAGQAAAGTKAGFSEGGKATEAAKSEKKKLNPLIWIIPAACLVIVGVLAIAGVFRGKDPEPTESSRKTSAAGTQEVVNNDTKPAQTDPAAIQTEPSGEAYTEASQAETAEPTEAPTEAPTEPPEDEPLRGELEKLMSFTPGAEQDYVVNEAGLVYLDKNTGALGLKSYDGVSDTGLLYPVGSTYGDYEDYLGKYLIVSSDGSAPEKTAESLNRLGIIDSRGQVIIPEGYASIIASNEYYAVGIRISEETDDPAEAVVTWSAKDFSSDAASDEKVYFKGEWELLSLKTGQPVPGFSGTKQEEYGKWKYTSSFCGSLIELNYGKQYILADGTELRSDAEVLDDGSYIIREPSKGTVFDTNGRELFTFDPNDYTIELGYGNVGYFASRKVSGGTGYTLLDEDGQAVSAEFVNDDYNVPKVCGPFLIVHVEGGSYSDGQVYDLQGNLVLEKHIDRYEVEYDELHHVLKLETIEEGNEAYIFISDDGEILLEAARSEVSVSGFLILKGNYYYNFATQAYDLDGDRVRYNGWIAVKNAGGKYDLVDTFTGETLLRGYDDYVAKQSPDFGTVVGAIYNQTVDIFILR